MKTYKKWMQDFPGGPVLKNTPPIARDAGSIPGLGISHILLFLFICYIMPDSLQPHELQQTRLLSPPLSSGASSNPHALSR